MEEIISTYSLGEFLLFSIVFASFLYAFLQMLDWLNGKFKLFDTSKTKKQKEMDEINAKLDRLFALNTDQHEKVSILFESDKSRIKGEIIKQHQWFTDKGYIDYQSLEYLQQQFESYTKEGGNSYVHRLMDDIENLPVKDEPLGQKDIAG